jgi:60 kDa SS-A/Ro ribonucleoprotein
MAQSNIKNKTPPILTHEGGTAKRITPLEQLERSVMSCFLWEKEFYEEGQDIATRISTLAEQVTPHELGVLAVKARNEFSLRHVPLLLLVKLAKTGSGTPALKNIIPLVIKRADELAEFVNLYWKLNPGKDITNQMKKGLRAAAMNFDEYELAKYDRDKPVKTRDVLFLSHVKPKDNEHAKLIARAVNKSYFPKKTKASGYDLGLLELTGEPGLKTPDTWEVALSSGADKKETWTRLINENKLGYMALLRNLRNMTDVGVDRDLVINAILARRGSRFVLPFRYVAAARAAPQFEPALDKALIASLNDMKQLPGLTVVLTDVSGSMTEKLSAKSDLNRMTAAATLSSIVPSDNVRSFSFSNNTKEIPFRKGMSGVEAIINSQGHGGTDLVSALNHINATVKYDRLIVTTDEQMSFGHLPKPQGKFNYMINVASAKNGVGYRDNWTHIDGFSESIFKYIAEAEHT